MATMDATTTSIFSIASNVFPAHALSGASVTVLTSVVTLVMVIVAVILPVWFLA